MLLRVPAPPSSCVLFCLSKPQGLSLHTPAHPALGSWRCACDLAFACLDGVGSWEADSCPGPASALGRPAVPGAQACSSQYYCFFLSWPPTTPSLSLTGFVHEKATAVVGLQWCWYRICTQDQVYVGLFRDLTFCSVDTFVYLFN